MLFLFVQRPLSPASASSSSSSWLSLLLLRLTLTLIVVAFGVVFLLSPPTKEYDNNDRRQPSNYCHAFTTTRTRTTTTTFTKTQDPTSTRRKQTVQQQQQQQQRLISVQPQASSRKATSSSPLPRVRLLLSSSSSSSSSINESRQQQQQSDLLSTTTTTTSTTSVSDEATTSTGETSSNKSSLMATKVLETMTYNNNNNNNNNNKDNKDNNNEQSQYITTNIQSNDYGPEEIMTYSLFQSIRQLVTTTSTGTLSNNINSNSNKQEQELFQLGLKGHPFVIRGEQLQQCRCMEQQQSQQQQQQQPSSIVTSSSSSSIMSPQTVLFDQFFTMQDLQKALHDDFLDAVRGSTDQRKGWKITDVSVPRGDSFDEARMTYQDVCDALEKGTVIFNAAGAHIPKLAGICLATCDATFLPCALNMYITANGKRTSAPPHTDKQDVCVIQTQGCKLWKVYDIPNPSIKPTADIFARGKGDDSLPLHVLSTTSNLLLETILYPGDVLFIPAGFPHTTSTVIGTDDTTTTTTTTTTRSIDDNDAVLADTTSIHLTIGIDHHIWDLNYLSVVVMAYRRSGNTDSTVLNTISSAMIDNPFVGNVNLLPINILQDVMAELPLGLLDEEHGMSLVNEVAKKSTELFTAIDPKCAPIDPKIIQETVERIRQQGMELLDIHRDMYIAAVREGQTRKAEMTMTAHLATTTTTIQTSSRTQPMSPDRIQRLSLFRVKRYYDLINDSRDRLKQWSLTIPSPSTEATGLASTTNNSIGIAEIAVGDKVNAELGGAFFPATVTRIISKSDTEQFYDVLFFDGDKETGLSKAQIQLISKAATPSKSNSNVDTSQMTAKQLKRWKKEQEKKSK